MKGDFFMKSDTSYRIRRLTAVAVFAALAYVIHFIHIPVGFLNLDFKDVIMAIAAMYFGPTTGIVLALLVPVLELPTSETGIYGLIMNAISSGTFVIVASVIYKFRRKLSGAIIALSSAALSTVAMMMLANLYITPYYMGVTQEAVVSLIPTLLLPFNAVKSVLNASLTLCLYKPVTTVLKKTGFGKRYSAEQIENAKGSNTFHSILVWIIGGAVAIAALFVIFFVLGGKISFN